MQHAFIAMIITLTDAIFGQPFFSPQSKEIFETKSIKVIEKLETADKERTEVQPISWNFH